MNLFCCAFPLKHLYSRIFQLIHRHGKDGLRKAKGQQGSQQRKFFHSTPLSYRYFYFYTNQPKKLLAVITVGCMYDQNFTFLMFCAGVFLQCSKNI